MTTAELIAKAYKANAHLEGSFEWNEGVENFCLNNADTPAQADDAIASIYSEQFRAAGII